MSYTVYVERQLKSRRVPNPKIPVIEHMPDGVTIEVVNDTLLNYKEEGARFADFVFSMVAGDWLDAFQARIDDLDEGRV